MEDVEVSRSLACHAKNPLERRVGRKVLARGATNKNQMSDFRVQGKELLQPKSIGLHDAPDVCRVVDLISIFANLPWLGLEVE